MRNRKQLRTLSLLASRAALRRAATGVSRTAGRYFDDGTITSKVEAAIRELLRATGLVVATEDRVVRLTGALSSQAHIDRASQLALGIGGVHSVRNDLRLLPH